MTDRFQSEPPRRRQAEPTDFQETTATGQAQEGIQKARQNLRLASDKTWVIFVLKRP